MTVVLPSTRQFAFWLQGPVLRMDICRLRAVNECCGGVNTLNDDGMSIWLRRLVRR
ncbi:hypothetical protein K443DRAFT_113848 [Laccaria amethystina LaAM-08-1]|uniref:Uncharacterized protein n=1 Tax=Laccaria amethystina LaAM-08-1 TaxID=1095629 RepID=A0A0C9WUM4_9AGAR|nr:hypothetical protein K443DRAFT_113848 [Laccaria amethystina LaAM-08-1]